MEEKVLYKGKIHDVLHKYDSGYWELREVGKKRHTQIQLVHYSELSIPQNRLASVNKGS